MIETSLKELDYSIFNKIETIIKKTLSRKLSYFRNYENWCQIYKKDNTSIPYGNVLSFGTQNSENFEVGVVKCEADSNATEPVYTKIFLLKFPNYKFKEEKIAEVLQKFSSLNDIKELKKQIKYILE